MLCTVLAVVAADFVRQSDGEGIPAGIRQVLMANRLLAEALRETQGVRSASEKVNCLVGIAEVFTLVNRRGSALQCYDEAWKMTETMESRSEVSGTVWSAGEYIAKSQVNVGFVEEALEKARRLAEDKDALFAEIGEKLAETSRTAEALTLREEVTSSYRRDAIAEAVIKQQCKRGEHHQSVGIASQITDAKMRATAFLSIARAQVDSGSPDKLAQSISEALKASESIPYPAYRWGIVKGIVAVQLQAKTPQSALSTAQAIPDRFYRSWAFRDISMDMLERGDLQGALVLAQTVEDDDRRAWALQHIALAQLKAGKFPESLHTITCIPVETYAEQAFKQLLLSLLYSRRVPAAMELARAWPKIKATKTGELPELERVDYKVGTLDDILVAARHGNDLPFANEMKVAFVRVLLDAGLTREAGELAKGVSSTIDESGPQAEIARSAARSGDLKRALRIARSIRDSEVKAWTLVDIGQAQVQKRRYNQTTRLILIETERAAHQIGCMCGSGIRSEILPVVACGLAKMGDYLGAVRTVRGLESESRRAHGFSAAARCLLTQDTPRK
ncbi:MAG: hypothetical protein HY318_04920 [Armatimonadetes bacterium]|nr:hypothetical protein [Armatimonadota bacterium]